MSEEFRFVIQDGGTQGGGGSSSTTVQPRPTPTVQPNAGPQISDILLEARNQIEAELRSVRIKAAVENIRSGPGTALMTEEAAKRDAVRKRAAELNELGPASLVDKSLMAQGKQNLDIGKMLAMGGQGSIGGVIGGMGNLQQGMAAGATGAAAAMPIVGAVLAGKQFIDEKKKEFLDTLTEVGSAFQPLARLDTAGAADVFTKVVEKTGFMGEAFGRVSDSVRSVMVGFDMTARRLSEFNSGVLGRAQVAADVRAIEGDIRRADKLGPDLARFVSARSRLEDSGQDLLAYIGLPLLRSVAAISETLAKFSEGASVNIGNFDKGLAAFREQILLPALDVLSPKLAQVLRGIRDLLHQTEPEDPIADQITQLLNLKVPSHRINASAVGRDVARTKGPEF